MRLEVREEDILRIIRLVRLDFLSFSSDIEEDELAVGGGDTTSLDIERLPAEIVFENPGLPLVCVDGGRKGDNIEGVEDAGSRLIDLRRSDRDARPWIIKSFTTAIEERRSLVVVVVVFEALEALEEVDSLLSWMVSLGGVVIAL